MIKFKVSYSARKLSPRTLLNFSHLKMKINILGLVIIIVNFILEHLQRAAQKSRRVVKVGKASVPSL